MTHHRIFWRCVLPVALLGLSLVLREAKVEGALGSPLPRPVPIERSDAGYRPGAYQSGVAVLLYSWNYDDPARFARQLDALFNALVEDHVTIVSADWPIYTDGVQASEVHAGAGTPPDAEIAAFIRRAHQHGLAVMLRPFLDEASIVADGTNEWRGSIQPRDMNAWFKRYGDLMRAYATIAAREGAAILCLGVELNSTERYGRDWRALIASVRPIFPGELTYSSNRGISKQVPWDALDFISVDAFFALDTPAVARVGEMTDAWRRWVGPLEKEAARIGKPLVLTEIGSTSQYGAHRRSWRWKHNGAPLDLEDQRRFYTASCMAWDGAAHGLYWWAVDIDPLADPAADVGFSPMGKPAEGEMARCYAARGAS